MSTWRSEMKKTAIGIASMMYKLEPLELNIEPAQCVAHIQDTAATLVQQSMFLRDGLDENVRSSLDFILSVSKIQGKTRNFAHPALKAAIIKFFYTSSYRIAHRRPDIFRSRIPNTCLAVICTVVFFFPDSFVLLTYVTTTLVQLCTRWLCEKRNGEIVPEIYVKGICVYIQRVARANRRNIEECLPWSPAW